ncbi:MAG: N-acetylmuramoyl-L-alanine amidase [Terriglobales bacterium]
MGVPFSRRALRGVASGLLCFFFLLPLGARSVAQKKQQAREQFAIAERMREELNGRPVEERSRRDYQRVTDAYRRVYYTAPGSNKADAAVVAVAELLAETGRRFNDNKSLQAAIGQYEFLRREYPGSKYRVDALFTIGQIYQDDLNDREQAKAAFQEFLTRYPRSHLAADAKAAIAELERAQKPLERVSEKLKSNGESTRPGRPLVTGIRHWSTPDYTRVAIDLESEVQYQTGRVPNPERIYFDLLDTKLASTLVGKSFEVQDGLLRKIRVAQYSRGLTRVVLEVDDLADYSAFLLPNPYRLIIDIHGRQVLQARKKPAAETSETASKEIARKAEPTTPKQPSKLVVDTVVPKTSPADAKPPAPLAAKVADGTTTPLKFGARPPAGEAEASGGGRSEAGSTRSAAAAKSAAPAKTGDNLKAANGAANATFKKITDKPVPELAKVSVEAKSVAAKGDNASDAAETTTIAKLEPPELTTKPTSAPTFESVAPRKTLPRSKRRSPAEAKVHAARPGANGEHSLIRALGLKIGRIVVDAGHGGHDTGTIGPNGLQEKDLVLDVALRLGRLLETKLGAEVIFTRDDDTFVPLETRTAIANQNQADLFISIHANSSDDPSARGVETFYLNFTSSPDALEVAARENAVSEKSIHELQDLVKKIAMKEKIEESREFAAEVQKALWTGASAKNPAIKNRGVKKAPFIVLIGANMPSILAEISFLSNSADERKLQTPDYRQKIAEYLYRGIAKYASGLSGVKVAQQR